MRSIPLLPMERGKAILGKKFTGRECAMCLLVNVSSLGMEKIIGRLQMGRIKMKFSKFLFV